MTDLLTPRLAALRRNLDAMASPDPEHPGLLLRDSYGYSERVLVIPPQLVRALQFFDGESSENDLREWMVQTSGSFDVGDILRGLVDALSESGFLENEVYFGMRDAAHKAFADSPVRPPSFMGGAYPDCPEDTRRMLNEFMADAPALAPMEAGKRLLGIAAPHVSFEGGWECYRDGFQALKEAGKDKTFVILATSHYGEAEKFGVTRKPYATSFGESTPANELLDEIAALAPDSVTQEDYCHLMEHSAEFHVLWLQYLFGPEVKVLPVLVGAFAKSIYSDEHPAPEADAKVAAFLDALRQVEAKHGDELCWVLSIDMAHMGQRYGDPFPAVPGEQLMQEVQKEDEARMADLVNGDLEAFWKKVQEEQDPLKWCGSAPLYTFYRTLPEAKAELLNYGQWNIDEASVVTFAGMRFVA